MKKIKYSVIVPVYNVENVLGRCIESILSQSIFDFEVVLVDDGSTDKSGKICDYYKNKDDRISVFHIKNGGVSAARNLGINVSKGEYIIFIDSDDYVQKDFLKHLDMGDCDFVISGRTVRDQHNNVKEVYNYSDSDVMPITPLVLEKYFENGLLNYCYAKRYSRKIICENNITFNENLKVVEDTVFVIEYILCCNNLRIIDKSDYQYMFYGSETLSSVRFNAEMFEAIEMSNEIIRRKLYLVLGEKGNKMMIIRLGNFYTHLFFEVFSRNINVTYASIKSLFSQSGFRNTLNFVDEIYFREGKKFCNMLKLKSSSAFWIFLKIVKYKNSRGIVNES